MMLSPRPAALGVWASLYSGCDRAVVAGAAATSSAASASPTSYPIVSIRLLVLLPALLLIFYLSLTYYH